MPYELPITKINLSGEIMSCFYLNTQENRTVKFSFNKVKYPVYTCTSYIPAQPSIQDSCFDRHDPCACILECDCMTSLVFICEKCNECGLLWASNLYSKGFCVLKEILLQLLCFLMRYCGHTMISVLFQIYMYCGFILNFIFHLHLYGNHDTKYNCKKNCIPANDVNAKYFDIHLYIVVLNPLFAISQFCTICIDFLFLTFLQLWLLMICIEFRGAVLGQWTIEIT